MTYLYVALGGALGSVARHALSLGAARWFGGDFPWGTLWGTLIVNVAGSFAAGLLATLALADGRLRLEPDARAFVLVGILGGFTTFSAFSLNTMLLAREGELAAAAANVALSLVLCLGAVWLGFAAASLMSR